MMGCNSEKTVLVHLSGKNWDAFNKQKIESLINEFGVNSVDYDSAKPPYVIFDWDNTSIFLDIEEAVLIYQLQNLKFGCNPQELDLAIRAGIKDTILVNTNIKGQKISFDGLAKDIISSYTWIYQNHVAPGGNGNLSLEQVKQNPHYTNFIVKLRFLYTAINDTYSAEVAYPWVTYLFTGLDSAQIRNMTAETVRVQLNSSISKVEWQSPSPDSLPFQLAGQVSIEWKNGIRLVPEMQELYHIFRQNGFDVWVCSASFVDVIKEISSNPEFGYNNPSSHVLAMELERDSIGRITPVFRSGYHQTQRLGKVHSIRKFLADSSGIYGYPPLFIAGDSEGDQDMLSTQNFPIRLGLIVNRKKGKNALLGQFSARAISSYNTDSAIYLLQGRDEAKGIFAPNQGDTNIEQW